MLASSFNMVVSSLQHQGAEGRVRVGTGNGRVYACLRHGTSGGYSLHRACTYGGYFLRRARAAFCPRVALQAASDAAEGGFNRVWVYGYG